MGSARGRYGVRGLCALMLCLLLLQHRFDASDALPTEEDLVRWEELHESVAEHAARGQVWVAPWGYYTTVMEGQAMRPNLITLEDYLGVSGNVTGQPIPVELQIAIERGSFTAIVFPTEGGGFRDLRRLVKRHYRPGPTLNMAVGFKHREVPVAIFTPREVPRGAGRSGAD